MEQIKIRQSEGAAATTTIFFVRGPMTSSTLGDFQDVVHNNGAHDIIISLEEVPYIDSTGLGAILGCWAHTQSTGNKFALVGLSPRVRNVMDITKTITVLPIFGTADQAEHSFRAVAASIRSGRADASGW